MNLDYSDIRDRIPEEPKWWDENAIPRYCKFSPDETADIYCSECVLMLIECQNCGHQFNVCMSWNKYNLLRVPPLKELILNKQIHYGDPPNINCCPAGPTMNSVPLKILEYWEKDDFEWKRDHELEIEVKPSWAD